MESKWERELIKPIVNGNTNNAWMEVVRRRVLSQMSGVFRPSVIMALAFVGLILVLGVLASNKSFLKSPAGEPNFIINSADVISLQVVGGLPGTKGSPVYQSSEENGKAVINKIVEWINSTKPVDGPTEFGKHGYPMVADITMNDGKVLTVEPAFDCVIDPTADGGTAKSCSVVKDEIVVISDFERVRLESKSMAAWLKEDWKHEFTQDGGLTTEEVLSKTIEFHNQTSDGIDFPAASKPGLITSFGLLTGGPAPGTKLNVDLSADVQFQSNKYLVTLKEDYNITVSGTKAISHWTYEVTAAGVRLIDKNLDGNNALLIK